MAFDLRIVGERASTDPPDQGPCRIAAPLSLRPTQFAVGYLEVSQKRKKLEAHGCLPLMRRLPVVLGPGCKPYLHDGHHYALALFRMNIESVGMVVVDDLSHLEPEDFWLTLAQRSWTRPIDGLGIRRPFRDMPENILAMEDDPFRSLAGALRRLGHYLKTAVPHADFVWADFLRRRISRTRLCSDFEAALDEAVWLIRSCGEAQFLPGLQDPRETGIAAPATQAAAQPPPQ